MLHEDFHKTSPQSYNILITCLHSGGGGGNEGPLELKAAKLLHIS